METALLAVLLVALATWVGGFVTLVVVAGAARATLEPAARVAFFRTLGRRFGVVGGVALALAIATALALAWPPDDWDAARWTTTALTGAVVVVLLVAVRQARAMTRRRRAALARPDDELLSAEIARHARAAGLLRAALGVLSLAALVAGAAAAT